MVLGLDSAGVFGGAWLLGDSARNRRAYLRATEERATRAETEQQLRAERAAAEERTRIAREMHEVLAHSMSLIVIEAEAGPVAMRTDPERASRLFDQISQAGRHALLDLRRL